MTSKERMMRALNREEPDRLPVTVHQWQQSASPGHVHKRDRVEAVTDGWPDAWTVEREGGVRQTLTLDDGFSSGPAAKLT